jgi:UV DNA damage endonuclease
MGLVGLSDMLAYLSQIGISFYRAALALPAEGGFVQLAECAGQLECLATALASSGVRVSVHLAPGLSLAGPDEAQVAAALVSIEATAALLAALDSARPPGVVEGIMVAHLGAPAADPAAYTRFVARYGALSARARARLALEHGGAGPSLGQLLALHQRCGVALVFDALHWELHNPERLPLGLALGLALATWPPGVRPEVHLSSQRSEAHLMPGQVGCPPRILAPRPGQHADYVAVADLERLLEAAVGLPPFDLMIEAKAGDLAVTRLRSELARRAPRLAARLG